MITNVAISSFRTATFPQSMKKGQVTPLLKKPGLETTDFKNFRPITNLTTISKIIERLTLQRLRPYLASSSNYCRLQSAYFTGRYTETALVKIVDDILDISAAFDMVDHNRLLERLRVEFGVTGAAKDWIASYLRSRSFFVRIEQSSSSICSSNAGVPQGSVLGPVLFTVYVAPHRSSHQEFWHRVPRLR